MPLFLPCQPSSIFSPSVRPYRWDLRADYGRTNTVFVLSIRRRLPLNPLSDAAHRLNFEQESKFSLTLDFISVGIAFSGIYPSGSHRARLKGNFHCSVGTSFCYRTLSKVCVHVKGRNRQTYTLRSNFLGKCEIQTFSLNLIPPRSPRGLPEHKLGKETRVFRASTRSNFNRNFVPRSETPS